MKGIVLAGGFGTRLYPLTQVINKQLMPVYDKPMIYYPISTLMLAGIRDILLISTPQDLPMFKKLLGSGEQWGITLQYCEQPYPGGLAEAFILGEDFIGKDDVCLILGDNIFYGQGLGVTLRAVKDYLDGAVIFGYYVNEPERYGVVEFDTTGKVLNLEEKPKHPKSNYAVTGLYFYKADVVEIAKSLKPSVRGELEITDVNKHYLNENHLQVNLLGRGTAWLDTGTHESLLQAAQFIQIVEDREGLKVACPEEIAWREGYITDADIIKIAEKYAQNNYGQYLKKIILHGI